MHGQSHFTAPWPFYRCRGFTLIELISVILIVSALSTVAGPRLISLTREAHKSVVARTAGVFESAIRMAFVSCVARNFAGKDNLPTFGAGNLDFNARCYPASTNGNNGNVNAARCMQIWSGVLDTAPSISTPAVDGTNYRAQGSGTICTFTYRRDTVMRRFTYRTNTGAVTVTANP
jgi:prepilin-type N-terminal cleavage/methylation domain-containing protein